MIVFLGFYDKRIIFDKSVHHVFILIYLFLYKIENPVICLKTNSPFIILK